MKVLVTDTTGQLGHDAAPEEEANREPVDRINRLGTRYLAEAGL
jgi:hypothetical protein